MLTTPVGKISQPFRSPFGWHILQVMETRDSNMANDREKAEIRQDLRDTKAQMLYAEWIRNLRDMAYVKISDTQ
jgi:peptidyl-prolyl cis-trans isomerase SurA